MAWSPGGNPLLRFWRKLYPGTPAEHALDPAVAALGVPYRFQHPTFIEAPGLNFFADFALLRERVIIEVDDDSHSERAKRIADAKRTRRLEQAGWRVVRCTNEEALRWPYATVNRLMLQLGLPLTAEPR